MKSYLAVIFLVALASTYGFTLQSVRSAKSLRRNDLQHDHGHHEDIPFRSNLDHFRAFTNSSLEFIYTLKVDHYHGGPIFIYIQNGGNITTEWLETGIMHDLAMDLDGALVTASHRFFGENLLTETASFENLQFLTFEQSVTDIAYLIDAVKIELEAPNARVVLYGACYGGTLAVAARQRFPHLVDAVFSSSGRFRSEVYTTETYLHLSNVILNVGGHECAHCIEHAFEEIEEMIEANKGQELMDILNLCEPVNTTSPLHVAAFVQSQIELFHLYFDKFHVQGIESMCNELEHSMAHHHDSHLEDLGRWARRAFGHEFGDCFEFSFDARVELVRREDWNQRGTDIGVRQWYYYHCMQLGLMQVIPVDGTIFPPLVTEMLHTDLCRGMFDGSNFDYDVDLLAQNVKALEILYGGLRNNVTNVVYTNAQLDIWYHHGMPANSAEHVINIPNYSHSADLRSLSEDDSDELRETKQRIIELIGQWVAE